MGSHMFLYNTQDYCDTNTVSGPPLLLILARFSSDMGHSTAMYLVSTCNLCSVSVCIIIYSIIKCLKFQNLQII